MTLYTFTYIKGNNLDNAENRATANDQGVI